MSVSTKKKNSFTYVYGNCMYNNNSNISIGIYNLLKGEADTFCVVYFTLF